MLDIVSSLIQGKYFNSLSSFLKTLKKAEFKYLLDQGENSVDKIDPSKFQIDRCSIEKYSSDLSVSYNKSIIEIESIIKASAKIEDKLFFISWLISEVESYKKLLLKDKDSYYTHVFFQFSNDSNLEVFSSVNIEKLYVQEYYKWMCFYQEKMLSFVINMKELTINSCQNESKVPTLIDPKINESTKERPIEFFEHLYARLGFRNFKHYFISRGDLDFYNTETETLTEYVEDENGLYQKTIKFTDYYHRLLLNEYYKSCKLIDDHISEIKDEAGIILFIKLVNSKLNYLLIQIEKNEEINKYDKSTGAIKALLKYIIEKYGMFLPENQIAKASNLRELNSNFTDLENEIEVAEKQQLTKFTKIDTNLTVDELGYLFKCLIHLNYFIQPKAKPGTSFHKTVASIFKCNGEDFVDGSFNNSYNTANPKAVDNWKTRFNDLKSKAQNELGLNNK